MKTFSTGSLLYFVQNLRVIASESEEEFDLCPSNVDAGVKESNTFDILEIISYFRSDPFTLIDLYIPSNPYKIALHYWLC